MAIGSVYSRSGGRVREFKELLGMISGQIDQIRRKWKAKIVLAGDWNSDLHELRNSFNGNNSKSKLLINFLSSNRLKIVDPETWENFFTWSRVRNGRELRSKIDYILVDEELSCEPLRFFPFIDVDSDHVPINVELKWFTLYRGTELASKPQVSDANIPRWNTSQLRGPPVLTGEFDSEGNPIKLSRKALWGRKLLEHLCDFGLSDNPADSYSRWCKTFTDAADDFFGPPKGSVVEGKSGLTRNFES